MKPKRWFLLALFLGSALLSAWLSPALSSGWSRAASGPPETALPGGMNGRTLLRSDEARALFSATTQDKVLEAGPYAIQMAAIQAAIFLPLWEEDTQVFLPLIHH